MNLDDELWGSPEPSNEPIVEPVNDEDISYDPDSDESIFDGETNQEPGSDSEPAKTEEEGDFMTKYLRSKSVDKSKIRILNEDNEEEEVTFDDLSDDEKIALLESVNQPMLSDNELEVINFLRDHNTDLNGFAKSIREQTIAEMSGKKTSTVDEVSDDDLFRFDLIDRYGFDREKDADEIENILEKEKENETLYNRKVKALREEYKQMETDQQEAEAKAAEAEQQQQWEQLKDNLIQVARNTNVINGLELDNQDKNEVLSCILNQDEVTGQTDFYKFYNNPEMMFKMAWYALKGDEAFRAVEDYYKAKLAEARRDVKKATVVNKKA